MGALSNDDVWRLSGVWSDVCNRIFTNVQYRNFMDTGLETVSLMNRKSTSRRFGMVECKYDTDWVKCCTTPEAWRNQRENLPAWRGISRGESSEKPTNPGPPGKVAVKVDSAWTMVQSFTEHMSFQHIMLHFFLHPLKPMMGKGCHFLLRWLSNIRARISSQSKVY